LYGIRRAMPLLLPPVLAHARLSALTPLLGRA
jgi:hypothetical protein